jgi:urocanate hydratase
VGKPEDLPKQMYCLPSSRRNGKNCPEEIQQQMQDIQWIKVQENKLVVGSQARILYADAEGRVKLPKL